jgi:hypothetical protein
MPYNASYARLFLEGFSYARQIDMQHICTPMLAKFYSCKMWVLQEDSGTKICHGLWRRWARTAKPRAKAP